MEHYENEMVKMQKLDKLLIKMEADIKKKKSESDKNISVDLLKKVIILITDS